MNSPDEFRAKLERIKHLWKQVNGLQAAIEDKKREIKEYQTEIERLKAEIEKV